MTRLADVFKLNPKGLNVRRGLGVLVVMGVPLIVMHLINQEVYYLSLAFGALFVGLNDPGREYGYRLPRLALNAVAGALLTVLGFAIGDGAWGVVVLAAFVITFAAGLMVKYGLHGFTAAYLLNSWFLVAIALPPGYHLSHGHTNAWAQGLAWLIGSALTIAWTAIVWLARGRTAQSQPAADIIPGESTPVPLTRPVILFALIRAIAVAIAVAIAFGFHLPNADWMPIACLVAMKSSLAQSTLVAMQRLAGAVIGAVVAALFLLTVDNKIVLEVVIVILGTLAGSIRAVNYALYCTAMAGMVLIADDLPDPTNLATEGRRVLFTFAGVGIAVVVMLLAGLLQKRTAKAAQAAPPASVPEGQAGTT
jgi:Fusaric acid resistance protein-like